MPVALRFEDVASTRTPRGHMMASDIAPLRNVEPMLGCLPCSAAVSARRRRANQGSRPQLKRTEMTFSGCVARVLRFSIPTVLALFATRSSGAQILPQTNGAGPAGSFQGRL